MQKQLLTTTSKDLNNVSPIETSTYLNSLGDVARDFHQKNNQQDPSKPSDRYIPVQPGVEQIREKALKTEGLLKLFCSEDLIINKNFDLIVRERKSIGKPHLKLNEAVLVKGVDFTKVMRKVDADSQIIVLTKLNLEVNNENVQKHKEEIKQNIKQIMMNAMYYHIITEVNVNSISQALHFIGYSTQNVRNFIDSGFHSSGSSSV